MNPSLIERLKQKHAELTRTGGKGGKPQDPRIWKPSGQHTIRIIPGKDGADFFREVWKHYNLGLETIISPKTFEQEDPALKFAYALLNKGDKAGAKEFFPKKTTYVQVLVRGEEHLGPRWWGMTDKVTATLFGILINPEYEDALDPIRGVDFEVTYVPAANEHSYPSIMITPKRNSSPLTSDTQVLLLIRNFPDILEIEAIGKKVDPVELESILESYLSSRRLAGGFTGMETANSGQAGTDGRNPYPSNFPGHTEFPDMSSPRENKTSAPGNIYSPNEALDVFSQMFNTSK